jgi:prolyl oligopeptidase
MRYASPISPSRPRSSRIGPARAILGASLLLTACAKTAAPAPAPDSVADPARQGASDVYFGVTVEDPHRWLEDLDSEATEAWVGDQNAATDAHLGSLPHRDAIDAKLTKLWAFENWSAPTRRGERTFFTYNDGTMDQPVLMVADTLDGDPRVLLDPNTLSEDGTVSVGGWTVSDDGARLAYALADAGSDWRTWKVLDVATGETGTDAVKWTKFTTAAWLPDGSGFVYGRFPEPDEAFEAALSLSQLYFHRVGTPQADDVLVFETPDHPDWGYWPDVDGDRLYITVTAGTEEKSRSYYLELGELDLTATGGNAGGTVVRVLDDFDANYWPITEHDGRILYFTDNDAPRGRVIAVDPTDPGPDAWVEVIAESDDTLRAVERVGDTLLASYLSSAHAVLRSTALDGTPLRDVPMPGLGAIGRPAGSDTATDVFFSFQSFTRPRTVYRHDVATGETEVWREPELPFDPSAYETRQVHYPSKDGTQVPMFLTHRKGSEPAGDQPTLLYGYGGFNIPITPRFKVANLLWIEMGGLYASANLRGGGEFGREWHEAGTKQHKQNVFDDFIAAGEYLVSEGWTQPERMAIHGRSNGGLLVGATLLQRPDLFGAAIPSVGVLDMLRYHKFTIGWAWASDYGTSEDSAEMFQYLRAYSPVHNAEAGAYPATLITTADHDDRVVPSHSFKFAAALQEAQEGDAPILIRIETRAGHGAGTPIPMLIDEEADKLAFLLDALGAEPEGL